MKTLIIKFADIAGDVHVMPFDELHMFSDTNNPNVTNYKYMHGDYYIDENTYNDILNAVTGSLPYINCCQSN